MRDGTAAYTDDTHEWPPALGSFTTFPLESINPSFFKCAVIWADWLGVNRESRSLKNVSVTGRTSTLAMPAGAYFFHPATFDAADAFSDDLDIVIHAIGGGFMPFNPGEIFDAPRDVATTDITPAMGTPMYPRFPNIIPPPDEAPHTYTGFPDNSLCCLTNVPTGPALT